MDEINNSNDPSVLKAFGSRSLKVNDFFQMEDSMRLRPLGVQLLKIFFDSEEFEHVRDFHVGEILTLSEKLNAPFYIIKNKLILFSSDQTIMLKMTGDISLWLELMS